MFFNLDTSNCTAAIGAANPPSADLSMLPFRFFGLDYDLRFVLPL